MELTTAPHTPPPGGIAAQWQAKVRDRRAALRNAIDRQLRAMSVQDWAADQCAIDRALDDLTQLGLDPDRELERGAAGAARMCERPLQ